MAGFPGPVITAGPRIGDTPRAVQISTIGDDARFGDDPPHASAVSLSLL